MITLTYGRDYKKSALEVLYASNLADLLKPGMKVAIKPNMVLAKPPSSGATTHVEPVEALIIFLKEYGISDIQVIESAWIGDDTKRAYKVCGYGALQKYGVEAYDLKDDKIVKKEAGGYTFEVFRRSVETDFLINVPVLKAHCQTRMTCCLKNLKGCISDAEKRKFHTLGLHKPIAYLNTVIKTHFNLIDGICGDLSFEEGGNPVTRNMLLACEDPVAADSYCAGLIGLDINDIGYLTLASQLSVGRLYNENMAVNQLNTMDRPIYEPQDGASKRLKQYIDEDGACSACYAALTHALYRLCEARDLPSGFTASIGQGFKGKTGVFGCGDCASKFARFVPGCPPRASDIINAVLH